MSKIVINEEEMLSIINEETIKKEYEEQLLQEAEEESMWMHNPETGERTIMHGSLFKFKNSQNQDLNKEEPWKE